MLDIRKPGASRGAERATAQARRHRKTRSREEASSAAQHTFPITQQRDTRIRLSEESRMAAQASPLPAAGGLGQFQIDLDPETRPRHHSQLQRLPAQQSSIAPRRQHSSTVSSLPPWDPLDGSGQAQSSHHPRVFGSIESGPGLPDSQRRVRALSHTVQDPHSSHEQRNPHREPDPAYALRGQFTRVQPDVRPDAQPDPLHGSSRSSPFNAQPTQIASAQFGFRTRHMPHQESLAGSSAQLQPGTSQLSASHAPQESLASQHGKSDFQAESNQDG